MVMVSSLYTVSSATFDLSRVEALTCPLDAEEDTSVTIADDIESPGDGVVWAAHMYSGTRLLFRTLESALDDARKRFQEIHAAATAATATAPAATAAYAQPQPQQQQQQQQVPPQRQRVMPSPQPVVQPPQAPSVKPPIAIVEVQIGDDDVDPAALVAARRKMNEQQQQQQQQQKARFTPSQARTRTFGPPSSSGQNQQLPQQPQQPQIMGGQDVDPATLNQRRRPAQSPAAARPTTLSSSASKPASSVAGSQAPSNMFSKRSGGGGGASVNAATKRGKQQQQQQQQQQQPQPPQARGMILTADHAAIRNLESNVQTHASTVGTVDLSRAQEMSVDDLRRRQFGR